MGNISGKDVGNFQAGVGKVDSQIGVVMSYVGATIFIILGIIMVIYAFIPTTPLDCDTVAETNAVFLECTNNPNSTNCKQAESSLKAKQVHCNVKKRNYWFLLGGLFIPFAVFIVWYAKWWNNFTHTNKTAAQIGGTMAEANMLSDIFNN